MLSSVEGVKGLDDTLHCPLTLMVDEGSLAPVERYMPMFRAVGVV